MKETMDKWLADRRAENRFREAVLERCASLGVKARKRGGACFTSMVEVSAEQLARLLDAVAAKGGAA